MIEVIDYTKCRGCRICVDYCPMDVLRLDTLSKEFPPCQIGCPAGTDIRGYMYQLNQGNLEGAIKIISDKLPMPAITGRVCAHNCELNCAREKVDEAVNICSVERYLGDSLLAGKIGPCLRHHAGRIAVIGSGPAGLSAAYELIRKGYPVTVFESQPLPGGMLRYGIPEYRLPREILNLQINFMEIMGIEFQVGMTLGQNIMLEELQNKGYKAIILATGAQIGLELGIEGEDSENVYSGVQFLKEINSGKSVNIGKRVSVIGGGNVAIDSARSAIRLGAEEVNIIYRRSREMMPAYDEGVAAAESEGIKFQFFISPTRFLSTGKKVTDIECVRINPGAKSPQEKAQLITIKGSEFLINSDMVITAIGEVPDKNILSFTGSPGVFACGDAITGKSSVIDTIASGQNTALAVERYLTGIVMDSQIQEQIIPVKDLPAEGIEKKPRTELSFLSSEESKKSFREVKTGFTEDMTSSEAQRCMTCGSKACISYIENCMTCYNCEINCPDKAIDVNPLRKIMPVLIRHPGDETNYNVLYTLKNKMAEKSVAQIKI